MINIQELHSHFVKTPMVKLPDFEDYENWELIEYWQVINLIATTITAGVTIYNMQA